MENVSENLLSSTFFFSQTCKTSHRRVKDYEEILLSHEEILLSHEEILLQFWPFL